MSKDVGLSARTENINSLFTGRNSVYRIPDFQRTYQWGQDELNDLWVDLLAAARNETDHYLGQIILISSKEGRHKIVDGQQRMVTVSLLVQAIGNHAQDEINVGDYIYCEDPTGERTRRLQLLRQGNPTDDKQYEQICGTSGEVRSNGNIEYAYNYYLNKLKKNSINTEKIINTLGRKFWITRMETTNTSSAYQIFQTQNRRGLDLPPIDLAKSMVLEQAGKDEKSNTEKVKNKWLDTIETVEDLGRAAPRRPIRYVLELTTENFGRKDTGKKSFVRAFEDVISSVRESEKSIFDFVSVLYDECVLYKMAKDGELELGDTQLADEANKLLRQCQYCYPHSGLVTFYIAKNLSDPQEIKQAAELMRKLVVRVNISDVSHPKKRRPGQRAVRKAVDGKSIKSTLKEQISKNTPSDNVIRERIKTKSFNRNKITRLVLLELEQQYYSGGSKSHTVSDFQLEHIAPTEVFDDDEYSAWESRLSNNESKFEQYMGKIGNIILIESSPDTPETDNPFKEKCEVYTESEFEMASSVARKYDDWSFNQIDDRTERLAGEITQMWSI